ncbi:uncharacterized protein LOC121260161 [Juglans microcarpa x Juglans regia]|uniref:uncharacterized protein LOC121260161 n=1 Tax=Juglans microcarpa x Juglans regia TaxID=2249226 RepID=UPI001B7DED77|nr:uncharacterized protein LOC121260161 [Juglans microcarpa x Juglans regia]
MAVKPMRHVQHRAEESNEDKPNPRETEDGNARSSQNMQMDCDDMIEEPKSGMIEKRDDETVRYVTLVCARNGQVRNRTLNVANPHPTGKTEFHNIHKHGLSPKKSRFFRCNRKVSDAVKRVLDTNDLASIRMNKSFGSLDVGAGGFENLPFLENDCRNYIDKARHLKFGTSGAGALQEYFSWMQYKNPRFFALMDLDDDGRSPIEKRLQDLYTNAKFKEVQQQVTGIIDMDPKLLKRNGAVETYLLEDEVRLEKFPKMVKHYVDFTEEDASAKCSCGLFEIRGILCRHILVVFKCKDIKSLPDRYILDHRRNDIKMRYTLMHSSYEGGEQCADCNRYSSLLNIYYQMITHVAGSKSNTEDATTKLYAMIELYSANQEPPSMT